MAFIKYTTGVVNEIEEFYQCACHSEEHLIKVYIDLETNQAHLIVALKKFGFFKRLIQGIKYLFGHESDFGHFDDFIFNAEDIPQFIKTLERVKI